MMRIAQPAVYIMASARKGTLYTGVTSELAGRVWRHKQEQPGSFTTRYGVKLLVYRECHHTMYEAIVREKQIKKWERAWKIELIESVNPDWRDLYDEISQ